ncbi:hypothetical protein ACI3E1_07370 [Ligilactobacillus sp. LYQ139]|uniref:hypothetical protein n=1 Tax=Ligilactobacillus sp. LYQ139 TaxID=3378800 RepID=UPI0038555191
MSFFNKHHNAKEPVDISTTYVSERTKKYGSLVEMLQDAKQPDKEADIIPEQLNLTSVEKKQQSGNGVEIELPDNNKQDSITKQLTGGSRDKRGPRQKAYDQLQDQIKQKQQLIVSLINQGRDNEVREEQERLAELKQQLDKLFPTQDTAVDGQTDEPQTTNDAPKENENQSEDEAYKHVLEVINRLRNSGGSGRMEDFRAAAEKQLTTPLERQYFNEIWESQVQLQKATQQETNQFTTDDPAQSGTPVTTEDEPFRIRAIEPDFQTETELIINQQWLSRFRAVLVGNNMVMFNDAANNRFALIDNPESANALLQNSPTAEYVRVSDNFNVFASQFQAWLNRQTFAQQDMVFQNKYRLLFD